jgi:hypothetical protein
MIKRSFLFIFLFSSLSNCTKEIEINLNGKTNKLAISCIFNEEGFDFYFSRLADILNGEYSDIDSLQIELFEENTIIIDSIIDTNQLYFSYYPKYSVLYQLKVTDLKTGVIYRSHAVIPKRTAVNNAILKLVNNKYNDGLGDIFYNEATITFTDNENEQNYYEIIIYGVNKNFTPERYSYWTSFESEDPILTLEGDLEYEPKSVFFSDELFNGEISTIQIYSTDGGGACQLGTCLPLESRIELRSISSDYFNYLKHYTRHTFNQQTVDGNPGLDMLFQGEPVDMYSNIENGYGIFTGFASSTQNFTLISTSL